MTQIRARADRAITNLEMVVTDFEMSKSLTLLDLIWHGLELQWVTYLLKKAVGNEDVGADEDDLTRQFIDFEIEAGNLRQVSHKYFTRAKSE
jgi:hypothetical protein